MSAYPINITYIREKIRKKRVRRAPIYQSEGLFVTNQLFPNVKPAYNQFGEKIIRVDGDIPPELNIENQDRFLFISYEQTALSHGLHKYPAKFFPELPRWLIQRYSKQGNIILDPFCGSGTTNVEALLQKRHSIGIDVDPFSQFLSKVKTTVLQSEELDRTSDLLLHKILHFRPEFVSDSYIPDFPYRDNWFNKEIILELAYILKIIEEMDTNIEYTNFYKVCLSSILRAVSNADNNCTRTVIRKKLHKQVFPADALTHFAEAVLLNVPKMKQFSDQCNLQYTVDISAVCDARTTNIADEYIDLAVTSPPYVNAVDYPRTHQLELYWLGLETGSLTSLKKKHVGTENVSVQLYRDLHATGIHEADVAIQKIYAKDKKRAYIAYKYLIDMEKNLREMYRVLKPGSRYIVVVGNNTIRDTVFENWRYITLLAQKVGFHLESYFASEIIKHFIKVPRNERINTDWILVLRKE